MQYKLQDLIDMEQFQNLQDRLNEIYSFPSAIIDNEGNVLTATAWQDVCTQFHRKNKDCERDCVKSDQYILKHLHEAKPAVSYLCPRGLVDNATPIVIEGIHYGNFFTGQFFMEKPDMEVFKEQAKKYGFNEDAYIEAVKKVPVWSPEQLNSYLFFIKGLIAVISESGLKKLREIEARIKTEESEERANAILRQMHDGFWIMNPQAGQIVDVNDALCRMLGYTREEMLKMSVADIEVNDPPDAIAQRIQQVIQAGAANFESHFRCKNGAILDVEASITYLPKQELFFGFHRDITERKRAEQAVQESEARLRAVVQTANDAIITMDTRGVIVDWNAAAEIIFGYPINEAIGMPISRIAPEQFRTQQLRGVKRALVSNERRITGKTIEIAGLAKNGREFPVEMSLAEWKTQAGIFFTAIIRDISERKQRENELQAIATVSAALRTASTRTEMLPVIIEQLVILFNCRAVSIEIIDSLTGDVVLEAANGTWQSLIGKRQTQDVGINAIIRQTRCPYYTVDLKNDPNLYYPEDVYKDIHGAVGVPLIAQDNLIGFVWMGRQTEFSESEGRLIVAVADMTANAIYRTTLHERTQRDATDLALAYDTTLEGWAHALELRDQETEGHTRRVVQMTIDLARTMGIGEAELENIRRGALLHDIGKMGIPDSVLLKPGTLNERELEIMRRHPEYAYKLLEPIEYLHPVLDIPYCHHEKWDGSGYPRGLKNEEIPMAARIFAVVDVWDALRSDRPYRMAWMKEKALTYIAEQSCKHFDPQVAQAFLEMLKNEHH